MRLPCVKTNSFLWFCTRTTSCQCHKVISSSAYLSPVIFLCVKLSVLSVRLIGICCCCCWTDCVLLLLFLKIDFFCVSTNSQTNQVNKQTKCVNPNNVALSFSYVSVYPVLINCDDSIRCFFLFFLQILIFTFGTIWKKQREKEENETKPWKSFICLFNWLIGVSKCFKTLTKI